MLAGLMDLRPRIERALEGTSPSLAPSITPLRVATAQLLLLTGTAAALERMARFPDPRHLAARGNFPGPLAWAPLLVAPLAAAAQLRQARNPDDPSAPAARTLNGACLLVGAGLVAYDLAAPGPDRRTLLPAPLAFAAAGLLGILLDRHVRQLDRAERELRRRGNVVERLVPRRRPRLDRIVVHV